MLPELPADPYARPLGRRWYAAFTVLAVVLAALVGAALTAEHWVTDRRAFKETLATFFSAYEELFLASLPGDDAAEYVVFLHDGAQPADVERFLAAKGWQRVARAGIFPGTVVVTLGRAGPDGLQRLRNAPFARLVVRNQGVFFCH